MSAGIDSRAVAAHTTPLHRWYVIWVKAVTRPTVTNFEHLLAEPDITFKRAFKWIVLASIAGGLLSWGIEPGFLRLDQATKDIVWSIGLDFYIVAWGIITFLAYVSLEHALARALGGRGSFAQLAFLSAAFTWLLVLALGLFSGLDNSFTWSGLLNPAQALGSSGTITRVSPITLFFTFAQFLISIVRVGLDRVAIRAVYHLGPYEALLPALVPLMLTICAELGLIMFT